mmetsp:Transcript_8087/g.17346  ORF Transcript_8087/g.17346 Transcript_8087/m.17346 type:complete len:226 (+) Transcript_8087:418-1095(+)
MAANAASLSSRRSPSSSVRFARFAIRDARESSARHRFASPRVPPSSWSRSRSSRSPPAPFDPLVSITLFLNANSLAMVSPSRLSRSFLFAEDAVPDFRYRARRASTAPTTPSERFDFSVDFGGRRRLRPSRSGLPGGASDDFRPVVLFSRVSRVSLDDSLVFDTLPLLEEDAVVFGDASCLSSSFAPFAFLSDPSFAFLSFSLLRSSTSASTLDERNLLSFDKTS